jgi:hypothetical protein
LIDAVIANPLHTLAITLSPPLSLVGVSGMRFLVRDTLNIRSMIGLILLMGLATKNAGRLRTCGAGPGSRAPTHSPRLPACGFARFC